MKAKGLLVDVAEPDCDKCPKEIGVDGEYFEGYDCWSADGEYFEDYDTAAEIARDNGAETIFAGFKVSHKAGDFIPRMVDRIGESAWDDIGEYIDNWPRVTQKQDDELQSQVAEIVNTWATRHNLQPKFFTVRDVKEIKL